MLYGLKKDIQTYTRLVTLTTFDCQVTVVPFSSFVLQRNRYCLQEPIDKKPSVTNHATHTSTLTWGQLARINSISSSEKSPCTTISSWFWLFFATEDPQANLLANNLAAFFKSTPRKKGHQGNVHLSIDLPKISKPWIVVMRFRFVRSTLLMVTRED